MAIPASTIVSVNPSVLSPGGTGIIFAGMILSDAAALPIGAPTSFATVTAVGDYFGTSSVEYTTAQVYFQGFDGSNIKPGLIWFAKYNTSAVAAFTRGAKITDLAAVQTITAGALSVTIDGVVKSTSTLNLSAATSFSNAASLIATALTLAGGQTCTYDSQLQAFVITSGTTGVASTITYVTGASATTLKLAQADGAVLSQGAAAQSSTTTSAFLDALVGFTQNWVSIMHPATLNLATRQAIATWVSGKNHRYIYAHWDSDATILQSSSSYTGFGKWTKDNSIQDVAQVFDSYHAAAMVCGIAASTDFTQLNGRVNFMFRTNSSMPAAAVDTATEYANLIANGYSAYCQFATQASSNMLANGQVTGSFLWLDSLVNAIWISTNLQADMVALLQAQKSIPYNAQGKAMISLTAMDTINSAVNFGAIRPGVTPSSSQASQMNAAAGRTIDKTVGSRGWYFLVGDASAAVRAARQSPPVTLWYADGQSVQQLNIGSVDVL